MQADTTRWPPLIALIGPRGSGKSTIARLVAERLGWSWLDADDVLERQSGRAVRQIFEEDGEAGFRALEATVLRELCRLQAHVLATGGGAVLREDNRALLRRSAWVVWLSANIDTLWQRMQDDARTTDRRPPLLGGGRSEVERVVHARASLYAACANFAASTEGRRPSEIAAEIAAAWAALLKPYSPG